MRVDFKKIVLAFVAVGFMGCDSGYVKETRDAENAIILLGQMKKGGVSVRSPKSYKAEKPNTQPPLIVLATDSSSVILVETNRKNEINDIKVDKCELSKDWKTSGDFEAVGAINIKCDAKTIDKIELETQAGKFTYKF